MNGDGQKLDLVEGFLFQDIFSELDVDLDALPVRDEQEVEQVELCALEPQDLRPAQHIAQLLDIQR